MTKSTMSMSSFFRNRFVRVIIASSIFLQIGIWVRNFAILLFVMEKTNNNPIAVSLISVAEFAPIFIFSFIGGTFADRWRPKRTMVWCDLLSAISVFAVLLTIIFATWEAVFFVTFISSILSQFSQPSAMKLFKVHVPEEFMQTGMAIFQTLMSIFMIIGPALGTIVFQKFGIDISISIMGVAFLLSASVLTLLPADEINEKKETTNHFLEELKEGFAYVWQQRELTILGSVFAVSGLAVGIIQPLGVFLIVERLGLPKENLQLLLMVNGAAMFIGGGLVMTISKKVMPQKLLAIGLIVNTISMVGMGLSSSWIIILLFQFLNGFFMPCIQIGINTLILQLTKSEFVGRVNGVLNPMFMGFMVITMSITGWLKSQFSLTILYISAGILFLIGAMLTSLIFNTSMRSEMDSAE
ncbi:MFS transporter [Clostridium beijerinckii]|uniref:MFS family arabinose efflux permease n=1 Tax=Clostridium beijerinckii TaxID=1520 RepID=A0AAX0B4J8_CLOBE|nr:MFS transporter [Clostridium beijerinckii]MBA8936555.1 putative MFS family arabinose efflux permease [Clostridium beijerinckii]NRT89394.1 putative MFS family arabinose efflux permease [Clostridium beijerinckii]NRU40977.1 putative MFS family arabinose efflux permease [Clostridium beijerinckii]NSA95748.1 putative MFS family arabinose efflux permease [Clostridium beijerinckii]NYC74850.1 putative MFS family arabinose efflux permease [Clostridium beijerinckii]